MVEQPTQSTLMVKFPCQLEAQIRLTCFVVRLREDVNSHGPVQDVTSLALRCGLNSVAGANILPVKAGTTLGFVVEPEIQHPGPTAVYIAKVPSGFTAKTWDGSGSVWTKIYQIGATFPGGVLTWPSDSMFSLLRFVVSSLW